MTLGDFLAYLMMSETITVYVKDSDGRYSYPAVGKCTVSVFYDLDNEFAFGLMNREVLKIERGRTSLHIYVKGA